MNPWIALALWPVSGLAIIWGWCYFYERPIIQADLREAEAEHAEADWEYHVITTLGMGDL